MNCNIVLHKELIKDGYVECPFCNEMIGESSVKKETCCDYQDIIKNNNGANVCQSCGIVQGYASVDEYVDFYENRYRIKRKSVYNRKYHINNVLTELSLKNKITYSVEQKNNIMRIFNEINKILPQINGERKRLISVNFILSLILRLMNLQYKYVKVSKSKKTLAVYQQYCKQIDILIGDKIKRIIIE